jgi:hypothetical protein
MFIAEDRTLKQYYRGELDALLRAKQIEKQQQEQQVQDEKARLRDRFQQEAEEAKDRESIYRKYYSQIAS